MANMSTIYHQTTEIRMKRKGLSASEVIKLSLLTVLAVYATHCIKLVIMATNNTTTVLRPFVRDYPGEPVPKETLTHPSS